MKYTAVFLASFFVLSAAVFFCLADTAGAEGKKIKINITAKGVTMTALLDDNPAARTLVKKFPMTVNMQDLYDREMCFRMGKGALPKSEERSDRYEVGDIIYWPPMGSLVILYAQNREEFDRIHLGHITGSFDVFKNAGDMDVTWQLAKD